MAEQPELPDWLKDAPFEAPTTIHDIRKEEEQDLSRSLEQLLPSDEVWENLQQAAQELVQRVEDFHPDVVVFTGRSSEFSQLLWRLYRDRTKKIQQVHLSSRITPLFYGFAQSPTPEEIEATHSAVEEEWPDFSPEQRIVVIDDYLATGSKGEKFLASLHRLGAQDVKFASFSGYDDRRYHPDIMVGLQDDELTDYIHNLAFMISLGNRTLEPGQRYYGRQDEIRRQTKAVLETIARSLS